MNTVKFTLKAASGLVITFSSPATAPAAGVILACTVVAAGAAYGGYCAYKHYTKKNPGPIVTNLKRRLNLY